jgi:PQQ-dependent dehydrogenase (methanol/ethanol family)
MSEASALWAGSNLPFRRRIRVFSAVALAISAAMLTLRAAPLCAQEAAPAAAADAAQFGQTCAVCHGGGAEGTDRAPALSGNRRLRAASEADIGNIIKNGRGNMPAFSFLAEARIQALAHFVHSLNADAFDTKPAGDTAAGAKLFFGSGRCSDCHTAQGRGGTNGPDLSNIGRQLTLAELSQALKEPGAKITAGYAMVEVALRDGTSLQGFARSRTSHGLVLQTLDGRLHLLADAEYSDVAPMPKTLMPAFNGTSDQTRDLLAFLSTLGGVALGPDPREHEPPSLDAMDAVAHPRPGEWPTYSGNVDGNRHSMQSDINVHNVSRLRPAWVHPLPYSPLETTPVVVDGVMYVTGPNQVYAFDARTGAEIWNFVRPRSAAGGISGDAAKGASRGVAVLGTRIFFITDDAHLICLQNLTGALLWEVALAGQPGHFGGTSAPLVVDDLVIAGVSGGDEGIRGFVSAFKATTGEQAWTFWTVPRAGEPNSQTWKGNSNPQGGASWTTPSYDAASGVLYVGVGNPYPDTDGDNRGGDNLYTDSDLALDAKTGKLLWYFQFTPHDVHDWDANQPLVLADAPFHGKDRKLLLHANRNGFFYVLDRTNGKMLQATPFVKKLTWASGIGPDGRPRLLPANETTAGGVETCPAVRGATNWYSTAYDPTTRLYYVMAVEDCTIYRKAHDGGYGRVEHPGDPAMKVLRAVSVDTGTIAWEVPMPGSPEANYSGVLSTGGLVFFGESSGGVAAVDARTGTHLWHFEANQPIKASPMTYRIGGRQYIAIASGPNILSFTLPDQ